MNAPGVVKQLGIAVVALAALALACSVVAMFEDDRSSLSGLLVTGVGAGAFGAFWLVLIRDARSHTGSREALTFVAMFWVITPLLSAPPFLFSGVVHSWWSAVFESTSNLTTTGSTLGGPVQPMALRLWRAALQFYGGVYSVVIAVMVLAALNKAGPGIHRSHFLVMTKDDLFSRLPRVALTVAGIYGGLAFMGAVLIYLSSQQLGLADGLCRSVAAISTSATIPGDGGSEIFSPLSVLVTIILMFIGATNIATHADITSRNGWRNYLSDNEMSALLIGVALLGAGACMIKGNLDIRMFAEALSLISTSGMSVTGVEPLSDRMPQPVPELIAFVGGSALSTAGGLKIARILILLNRSGNEFTRLAYSHSLAPFRYKGRRREDDVVVGVWVYLVAYTAAACAVGVLLTLSGSEFDTSFRAAIGAISNTGSLMDVAVSDQAPSNFVLLTLCIGCILGRIEVLAIAPLFTLDFWRK